MRLSIGLGVVVVLLMRGLVCAALMPGDVLVTGYNCDGAERDFTFMALVDVADTETFYFTDKGWTVSGALCDGEGVIAYTPPPTGLTAGTVVHVTNTTTIGSTGADLGTAIKVDLFRPAGGGDQILVYQGSEASPTFISALCWDSTDWVEGDDLDKSLVPPGLIEGVTALHTCADLGCGAANLANGACTQVVAGLKQDIMAHLRNPDNWSFDAVSALSLSSQDTDVIEPLAFQGFEGDVGDTWPVVSGACISSSTGSGDAPSCQRVRSGNCSHQASNTVTTLLLSDLSTRGHHDMSVTLHISSTATGTDGMDVDDMVQVFVALNGAAFPVVADLAVEGYSNARWSYSGVSLSTTAGVPVARTLSGGGDRDDDGDGYSTLSIVIPDATTSVQLKVKTISSSQSDIWNIDDIFLIGTRSPVGTIMVVK